jgi:hypothetical protein
VEKVTASEYLQNALNVSHVIMVVCVDADLGVSTGSAGSYLILLCQQRGKTSPPPLLLFLPLSYFFHGGCILSVPLLLFTKFGLTFS